MSEQEPALILATSQAKNIIHNYVITAPSGEIGDARIDRGLRVLGYPEEHDSASCHVPFYRECELRGIRTLFSGFGGDEVVTNQGHHLRMELLDGGHYDLLWNILPGSGAKRFLRLVKAMTVGRKSGDSNVNFLMALKSRWPHQIVRSDVVESLRLYPQYLEAADFDAPYRRINTWIINGLLSKPYIATRLENCTLLAASYGIDYRWPLWDARLVQQYLSTPSIEKFGPQGIGRYLHRRAVDGVVPQRVAWKPSKDMGYAALHKKLESGSGLMKIVAHARHHEAHLHPTLATLIDQKKYRQQIKLATQGNVDQSFSLSFGRQTRAIRWLNLWLHEGSQLG